jgi:hypothetical protein
VGCKFEWVDCSSGQQRFSAFFAFLLFLCVAALSFGKLNTESTEKNWRATERAFQG